MIEKRQKQKWKEIPVPMWTCPNCHGEYEAYLWVDLHLKDKRLLCPRCDWPAEVA